MVFYCANTENLDFIIPLTFTCFKNKDVMLEEAESPMWPLISELLLSVTSLVRVRSVCVTGVREMAQICSLCVHDVHRCGVYTVRVRDVGIGVALLQCVGAWEMCVMWWLYVVCTLHWVFWMCDANARRMLVDGRVWRMQSTWWLIYAVWCMLGKWPKYDVCVCVTCVVCVVLVLWVSDVCPIPGVYYVCVCGTHTVCAMSIVWYWCSSFVSSVQCVMTV